MPEIKRTFSASKMNRDIDERLVPPAEYRDALNIEINTSDGSNVGTVQTILGNTALTTKFPAGSFCVGSIADSKTDKIYWLIDGVSSTTNNVTTYKDYIAEYDIQNALFKYVLVDIYKVEITTPAAQTSSTSEFLYAPQVSSISGYNNTGIRIGMNITHTNATATDKFTVEDIQWDSTRWKIKFNSPEFDPSNIAGFATGSGDTVTFTSERLLNFDSSRLITGINVLDGMLFWTDDYSEPKKINIERCIKGTGGSQYLEGGSISVATGDTFAYESSDTTQTSNVQFNPGNNDIFHTRLVSSKDGVDLEVMTDPSKKKAVWLEEGHITVLRKAPLTPPYLEMSSTEVLRTDVNGNSHNISTTLNSFAFANISGSALLTVDGQVYDSLTATTANIADTLTFDTHVDFRVGDVIMLTNNTNADPASFTDARIRIRIEPLPGSVQYTTPTNGPYNWSIVAIDTGIGTGAQDWSVRLEQSRALFEDKFVRFAYRYKYKDGEYSVISPWSELAFLPGNYDYMPKQGYNLGMVNQLRSLKITDYVVEDFARGHDVIEVDILFKNEDSPNIYTVKTIKPTDMYKDTVYTGNWPDTENFSKDRGKFEIESELIHAILPSNQLLRPWDNVPIKAKTQDITANRLIYGNYIQNYDVTLYPLSTSTQTTNEQITPDIQVTLESTLGDLAGGNNEAEPIPSKSVKSLRTYQVGVVYRDELGRETPVLAGDAVDSTITVNKKESLKFNKIKATMGSPIPHWVDSWKFFIKETSNEYYSLAMDRWYNAEDGNVWISFPSAERNKIQDDSFLILKKQHTTDQAVVEEARYKVISVKNEAPEYIKRNTKKIGKLTNSATGVKAISTAADGFPFIDFSSFKCDGTEFKEEFLVASQGGTSGDDKLDMGIREAMHNGFLFVKLGSGLITSGYYKVANMVETAGSNVKITIDGKFGEDVRFLSPLQTTTDIVGGVFLEMATMIPENKAEFDGKFFVKILKNLVLQDNLLRFNSSGSSYSVVGSLNSYYINYSIPYATSTSAGALIKAKGTANTTDYHSGFFPINPVDGEPLALEEITGSGGTPHHYWDGGIFGANDVQESARAWWRAFGGAWFIDSAITANEDNGSNNQFGTNSIPKTTSGWTTIAHEDIAKGTHGIFDMTTTGDSNWTAHSDIDSNGIPLTDYLAPGASADGTAISLSWSGVYPDLMGGLTVFDGNQGSGPYNDAKNHGYNNVITPKPPDINVGVTSHVEQGNVLGLLYSEGTQFRFGSDPEQIVYTIRKMYPFLTRTNYDSYDADLIDGTFHDAANKRLTIKLVVTDDQGYGIGNKDGTGMSYNPLDHTYETFDVNGDGEWGDVANVTTPIRIDFIEPYSEDDTQVASDNPAVWETEPKEDVGLDIYYEASPAYPIDLNLRTNEQFVKYGSIVKNETAAGGTNAWTITTKVTSWSDQTVTIDNAQTCAVGDIISFTAPDGGVTRLKTSVENASGASSTINQYITFENTPHEQTITLPYFNCYSFQNGVESNRIRDDYNASYIRNGVKASAVLAKHYEQERRGAGLIHSGIYNSTSGINNLNQFIQAEPITKDLNPRHGSIQKLLNRNTDLAVITEDKCFKILADKDALFNADGSSQLVASKKVLGQITPYAGDFGTTNPESFARDNFRAYFVDKTRGKVCRLSMDGITPISSAGMHDWFADNLQVNTSTTIKTTIGNVIGSFDAKKQLYNITINQQNSPIEGQAFESPTDTAYTLSYSETAKGWVSFKSFHPESGLSINNDYYTFKDGELWKHHVNETRNNFYGTQYDSHITTILNDQPGSIKSFNTLNYEGSQAKITQWKDTTNLDSSDDEYYDGAGTVSQADGEYYNLNTKTGWYVDSFETNEQTATIPEFIEKEGKWFNYIRGEATSHINDSTNLSVTSSNLDQQEFSVQGIGIASAVSSTGEGTDQYKLTVQNKTGVHAWDSTAD